MFVTNTLVKTLHNDNRWVFQPEWLCCFPPCWCHMGSYVVLHGIRSSVCPFVTLCFCMYLLHNRYLKANLYKLQRILRAWKVGKIYFHMLIPYGYALCAGSSQVLQARQVNSRNCALPPLLYNMGSYCLGCCAFIQALNSSSAKLHARPRSMELNNRRTGKHTTKPRALGLLGHSDQRCYSQE